MDYTGNFRWGLECWNTPDEGTDLERTRITALGGGLLKVRAYHPLSLLDWYAGLCHDWGLSPLFLLRRSADGAIDVAAQVAELGPQIAHCHDRGYAYLVGLDNEPNHPDNPSREMGPEEYCARLNDLIEAMQEAYPSASLAAPPLAVQHDDLDWLAYVRAAREVSGLRYQLAHVYWQYEAWSEPEWGGRLSLYRQIDPHGLYLVDEVGDATPPGEKGSSDRAAATLAVLQQLRGTAGVAGTAVFIAGGTDHWRQYWLDVADLAQMGAALSEGQQPELPAPSPEPPNLPAFVLGFADHAAGQPWRPLRDQGHDWAGDAWQPVVNEQTGRRGALHWSKEENTVRDYWENDHA